MRTPVRLFPLVAAVTVAAVVVLLAGCTEDQSSKASTSQHIGASTPRLGGRVPERHPSPERAMNDLERQVAGELSPRVARMGLTLGYLDCPHWDHAVPSTMTCHGYVEGLVARVTVHVRAGGSEAPVLFDARLTDGVVATQALEELLSRRGWTRPDCGDVPAYPAVVGSRIICRVHRSGRVRYVAATVEERSGTVVIADYQAAAADR